jgi:hypothetical protein
MDIINWWLGWPGRLQDLSLVFLLLVFLSRGATYRVGGLTTLAT